MTDREFKRALRIFAALLTAGALALLVSVFATEGVIVGVEVIGWLCAVALLNNLDVVCRLFSRRGGEAVPPAATSTPNQPTQKERTHP